MKTCSLLAVDDCHEHLLHLEQLMSRHLPECELVTACSADEGLNAAGQRTFDGALIKVRLPNMNGIEMCGRLKAQDATCCMAVLLIAYKPATPQMRAAGLDAGADDFITQPIDETELIARIRAMLRRQQTRSVTAAETQQRQAQLAYLSRLNTMNEMSTAIAHELNQPLCAIVTSAQACRRLLKALGDENAALLRPIDEIVTQAKRAGDIIRRLREFTHRRPTHRSTLDLSDVIRDAVRMIASEAQDHHVRVCLSLPESPPPVIGDTMQIEQVLVNLMRNAIEAMQQTHEDERELDIRLSLPQTGSIEVAVRDTGRGLSDGNLERLFGAFFSTKPQGMGIGLTVSRSIIEAHGGQLWAKPASDRGMVFYFTLPTGGHS